MMIPRSNNTWFFRHIRTIGGIVVLTIYSAAIATFAAPPTTKYTPGATLDPSCIPGNTNCSVQILPDQSTNTGKYLTTDGSTTSWSLIGNASLQHASISINGSPIALGGSVSNLALTTNPLSQFAATTSSQLAGILTDETGTGNAVFSDTPTFTTSITTPSILSSGALALTPAAGSNLNISLATTGDLAVNTNQLYVDTSTGRVGIGTSTPQSKFSVNGDIRISAGSGGQIIFADGSTMSSSGLGSAAALSAANDAIITGDSDSDTDGDVIVKTGSTERLHIANDGTITFPTLSTGLLHATSGGVLSSSLIVNSDITDATIASSKLVGTDIATVGTITTGIWNAGAVTSSGAITGTSFVKTSGTSSQFLKADGSVDSNTYLTTSSASSTYLPLAGGTLTGALQINSNNLIYFADATNNYFPYIKNGGSGTNRITLYNTGGSAMLTVDNASGVTAAGALSAGAISGTTGTFSGALTLTQSNINLSNAYYLTARNNANNAYVPLIGRNTSDNVVIDPDGYGTVFGGGISGTTGTFTGVLKTTYPSNQQLEIHYDASHTAYIGSRSNGDVQIYGYDGSVYRNILLGVDGSAVGGNVGIGTISPGYKLHVAEAGALISMVQNTASTADARVVVKNTLDELQMGVDATGGYFQIAGASPLRTYINGSEVMRIASNGNVGIGVTNPSTAKLVVASDWDSGATNNSQLYLQGATNSNKQLRIGVDTAAATTFGYIQSLTSGAGLNPLAINPSGGNVGIGTTNPQYKLDVAGTSNFSSQMTATAATFTGLLYANTDINGDVGLLAKNVSSTGYGAYIQGGNSNTYIAHFTDYAGTSRMIVLGNGNVGIGLTNPQVKLHIQTTNEAIRLQGAAPGDAIYQSFYNSAGTRRGFLGFGATSSSTFYVSNDEAGSMIFQTNNSSRLLIDANGFVGVGIAAPETKFQVNGTSGITSFTGASRMGISAAGATSTNDYSGIDFDVISASSPRARIAAKFTSSGSYLQFGTSNNYSAGITNTALSIDYDGNIGIGITNPGTKLDVQGSNVVIQAQDTQGTGYAITRYRAGGGGVSDAYFGVDASSPSLITGGGGIGYAAVISRQGNYPIQFATNNLARMTIDGSGNIGIGATGPTTKLHISQSSNDRAGGLYMQRNGSTYGLSMFVNSGGYGVIGSNGDFTKDIFTMDLNAGSVGIGANAPVARLEVRTPGYSSTYYPALIANTSYPSYAHVSYDTLVLEQDDVTTMRMVEYNNGSTNQEMTFSIGDDSAKISTTAQPLSFWVNGTPGVPGYQGLSGTEAMRIATNGQLLIGQTVGISNSKINITTDGVVENIMTLKTTATSGTRYLAYFLSGVSNTNVGSITHDGTSTSYNTTSDQRLKENIVPTARGLDTLMHIGVRDFDFISDPEHHLVQGFIAQDLYNYYPEAVTVGGDDPQKNPWQVDYGRLTPLIVQSIQDLGIRVQAIPVFEDQTLYQKITDFLTGIAHGIASIGKVQTDELDTKNLCVSDDSGAQTCVTKAQLDSLLSNASGGVQYVQGGGSGGSSSNDTGDTTQQDTTTDTGDGSTTPDDSSTSTDTTTPDEQVDTTTDTTDQPSDATTTPEEITPAQDPAPEEPAA